LKSQKKREELANRGGIEMIGTTLSHFRIIDKLGEGGMGEVWLAEDSRLGRKVALKILPPSRAESEDRRRRFKDEARAASALNHPGIAHIYDVGEEDGINFIAMEHIEGEGLDARMARRQQTVAEVLDFGMQLAGALASAHGQSVTHRDIKPSNLMITPDKRLKVLDFGIAKLRPTMGGESEGTTRTMTQPGVVMGTFQYMSPEQALGKEADHRSDIFSAGVVLYQLVTGRLPFKGSTPTETITEIVRSEAEPVSELNPSTPPELERIVRKCLEKDADRRYQSARELAIDIGTLRRDTESGFPAVAAPAMVKGHRSRYAVVAIATVMAAAAVLFVGGGLMSSPGEAIESIAVLPFENGTGDVESEYICDGLAENLIASLSQLPDLRVISRRSAFRFKNSMEDLHDIGRQLDVQALVVGRVVQRGDDLQISAELVNAADNSQLWGAKYDRRFADVVAIEHELVTTIADALHHDFSAHNASRLDRNSEVDPEAYRLYLKARDLFVGSTREMNKGVEYLEQAIARSPEFAPAHAALGDAFLTLAYHNVMERDEALKRSKGAVRRAIEIDPELGDAYAVDSQIKLMFDWDWLGTEQSLRRAVQLSPGSLLPRLAYGDFLTAMGRWDEVIEQSRKAKELDPLSPSAAHWLAIGYLGNHEYDKAVAEFKTAVDLNPNWTWGYVKLAKTYADSGRCEEALATAEEAEAQLHGGSTPLARGWLGYTYAVCGEDDLVSEAFRELDRSAEHSYVDPLIYADIYCGLGDTESVLEKLEEAVDDRSPDAIYLLSMPGLFLQTLTDEPRYQALIERMDFPRSQQPVGSSS
jgi:serine/threonine-protein kinase